MKDLINKEAINFCLKNQNEKKICLLDFKGKWIILYFYPKDNTSGCTKEAIDFSENIEKFKEEDAIIIGISPDSPKKHKNFIKKHNLKHILLSDENHEVIEKYNAWGKKKLYGKEYYGVIRSTFIISPDFKIKAEWKKVKVKNHANEVLAKLKELKSNFENI